MLGCIFEPSSATIFKVITFSALLTEAIIGASILKNQKKVDY
jgi:hypothetical protein